MADAADQNNEDYKVPEEMMERFIAEVRGEMTIKQKLALREEVNADENLKKAYYGFKDSIFDYTPESFMASLQRNTDEASRKPGGLENN